MKTTLSNIILAQTSFKRGRVIDFKEEFTFKPFVKIGYVLTENDILVVEFTYSIDVIAKDDKDEDVPQINYSSTHIAQFEVHKEGEEDNFENKLERFSNINAAAIIFPFIRENVATITAKAGMSPIMIPVTNFVELYEEKKKQ